MSETSARPKVKTIHLDVVDDPYYSSYWDRHLHRQVTESCTLIHAYTRKRHSGGDPIESRPAEYMAEHRDLDALCSEYAADGYTRAVVSHLDREVEDVIVDL